MPGTTPNSNADQIAQWNSEMGKRWVQYQDDTDHMLAGLTTQLLARAEIKTGDHIIDVGCGCGTTLIPLAQRTGPNGGVTGIDVSNPMLARAKERIISLYSAQSAPVKLIEADAETYPFSYHSADLIFSRFGVMFFANPEKAFLNLHSALKTTTGHILFMCWRSLEENPWVTIPLSIALRHVSLPASPPPGAPGPFAFGQAEHIERILTFAGFELLSLEAEEDNMPIAGQNAVAGAYAAAVNFTARIGPLAQLLRDAPDDTRDRIRSDLFDELQAYDSPQGPRLKGRVWIVSAKAK